MPSILGDAFLELGILSKGGFSWATPSPNLAVCDFFVSSS